MDSPTAFCKRSQKISMWTRSTRAASKYHVWSINSKRHVPQGPRAHLRRWYSLHQEAGPSQWPAVSGAALSGSLYTGDRFIGDFISSPEQSDMQYMLATGSRMIFLSVWRVFKRRYNLTISGGWLLTEYPTIPRIFTAVTEPEPYKGPYKGSKLLCFEDEQSEWPNLAVYFRTRARIATPSLQRWHTVTQPHWSNESWKHR